MKQIILASASPRRKALLKKAGIKFKAVKSNFKEVVDSRLSPALVVKKLSLGKARAVAKRYPNAIVVGADTVVVFKGKVLGKPHTPKRAKKMLQFLSGAAHFIYTGFAVIDTGSGKAVTKHQKTKVVFRKMALGEIEDYIKTGEPLDRAGAYAIQSGAKKFVQSIEGDFSNALGLPIDSLKKILEKYMTL